MSMKVTMNKRQYEFPEGSTLERVIGQRLIGSVAQIWVNDEPLHRTEVRDYVLHDGDVIRVQRLCAGG